MRFDRVITTKDLYDYHKNNKTTPAILHCLQPQQQSPSSSSSSCPRNCIFYEEITNNSHLYSNYYHLLLSPIALVLALSIPQGSDIPDIYHTTCE